MDVLGERVIKRLIVRKFSQKAKIAFQKTHHRRAHLPWDGRRKYAMRICIEDVADSGIKFEECVSLRVDV